MCVGISRSSVSMCPLGAKKQGARWCACVGWGKITGSLNTPTPSCSSFLFFSTPIVVVVVVVVYVGQTLNKKTNIVLHQEASPRFKPWLQCAHPMGRCQPTRAHCCYTVGIAKKIKEFCSKKRDIFFLGCKNWSAMTSSVLPKKRHDEESTGHWPPAFLNILGAQCTAVTTRWRQMLRMQIAWGGGGVSCKGEFSALYIIICHAAAYDM